MILIRNLEREPRVYEIPLTHAPGLRTKIGASDRDTEGNVVLRVQHKTLPSSITLMAKGTEGDTSEPLPNAICDAPALVEAHRLKRIQIVTLPDAPAPAAEPTSDSGEAPQGA